MGEINYKIENFKIDEGQFCLFEMIARGEWFVLVESEGFGAADNQGYAGPDRLADGEGTLSVSARLVEGRVRRHRGHGEPGGIEPRPVHLNVIKVPFERDTIFPTRYSDASFAAWYGSLQPATTIYETAYLMIRAELTLDGGAHPGHPGADHLSGPL